MAADGFQFAFTPEVEAATAPVWEKVKRHVTPMEWRAHAPLIAEINRLKREKNAVILAHNYMTPEIFHGVGDYVGDSLGLAREAARSRRQRSSSRPACTSWPRPPRSCRPDKTVLIPDLRAGCSLAASITGADVRLIKQRYPGLPVVTYVNTTAEVKAETDICCTSANAVQVVEEAAARVGRRPGDPDPRRVPGPQRRAPDRHQDHRLAGPLRGARALHRRRHPASCEAAYPDAEVLAHPECPAEVLEVVRLRRLDRGDDRLCADQRKPQAGGADHRVLDGRQRRRRRAGHRVRAALQPVPAHEADHAWRTSTRPCCTSRYEVTVDPAVAERARAGGAADDRPAAAGASRPATTWSRRATTSTWS